MFEQILVPLDGSRFGSSALKYAISLAQHFSAQVTLVQAVKPAIPSMAPAMPEGMVDPHAAEIAVQGAREQDRRNVTKVRLYLRRKARELRSTGLTCSYSIPVGEPAQSILNICRKEGADLIIMSTHGKGGLKRAILGSIADEVSRKSRVAVLLVPQRRLRRR